MSARPRSRMPAPLVLCSLVCVLSPAAGAKPSSEPARFVVAFSEGPRIELVDTNEQIHVVAPNGKMDVDAAALSPDGTRLAYVALNEASTYQELYLSTAPFTDAEHIGATRGWHRDPVWASNSRLVFALHVNSHYVDRMQPGHNAQIYEEDVDRRELKPLSRTTMCHHMPTVLPSADGKPGDILFTRTNCSTTWNIARLDPATGEERMLTTEWGRNQGASVSPDGSRYAYAHVSGGVSQIRIESLDPAHPSRRVVMELANTPVPQLRWFNEHVLLWWADGAAWRLDVDQPSAKATKLREAK